MYALCSAWNREPEETIRRFKKGNENEWLVSVIPGKGRIYFSHVCEYMQETELYQKPPADIVVLVVDCFLQYIQQGGKKRRSALKYEMSVSHQSECLTELFISILLRLDFSQGFAEGFLG